MPTEKNILNKKITDLPAWLILLGAFLAGGAPGVANLLTGGAVFGTEGNAHIQIESRINQLETNQSRLLGVAEKQNEVLQKLNTDVRLSEQRIELLVKELDKMQKK